MIQSIKMYRLDLSKTGNGFYFIKSEEPYELKRIVIKGYDIGDDKNQINFLVNNMLFWRWDKVLLHAGIIDGQISYNGGSITINFDKIGKYFIGIADQECIRIISEKYYNIVVEYDIIDGNPCGSHMSSELIEVYSDRSTGLVKKYIMNMPITYIIYGNANKIENNCTAINDTNILPLIVKSPENDINLKLEVCTLGVEKYMVFNGRYYSVPPNKEMYPSGYVHFSKIDGFCLEVTNKNYEDIFYCVAKSVKSITFGEYGQVQGGFAP